MSAVLEWVPFILIVIPLLLGALAILVVTVVSIVGAFTRPGWRDYSTLPGGDPFADQGMR